MCCVSARTLSFSVQIDGVSRFCKNSLFLCISADPGQARGSAPGNRSFDSTRQQQLMRSFCKLHQNANKTQIKMSCLVCLCVCLIQTRHVSNMLGKSAMTCRTCSRHAFFSKGSEVRLGLFSRLEAYVSYLKMPTKPI